MKVFPVLTPGDLPHVKMALMFKFITKVIYAQYKNNPKV